MRFRDLGEKSLRKLKSLSSSICGIGGKNNCPFLFLLFESPPISTTGAEIVEMVIG